MALAVIAMGGNLGDVPLTLRQAVRLLEEHSAVSNVRRSRLYSSAPVGASAGDAFFNAALACETRLEPIELLDLLQSIETQLGRTRNLHWGPRTIDLDVVFYGDRVLESERLTLPHPHCWYRRFVLDPVADLCPDFPHPVLGRSVAELRDRLRSQPVRILIGSADDLGAIKQTLPSEFPDVEFVWVEQPDSVPRSAASLGLWIGNGPDDLAADWLRGPNNERATQFVRDALSAAFGRVVPVGDASRGDASDRVEG